MEIPEEEWQNIQKLADRIQHRAWEQEKNILNLNNLLHALHGEGVRSREFTNDGQPKVFKDGKWVNR